VRFSCAAHRSSIENNKKMNVAAADYKTQRVSLNPILTTKKKTTYNAIQTVEILLRDLSQYDALMEGLVNEGVNKIDNVVFSLKLAHQQKLEN
jgi:uncharacterized protein YggE